MNTIDGIGNLEKKTNPADDMAIDCLGSFLYCMSSKIARCLKKIARCLKK